jgi:Mce-associated membrane protein
MVNLVVSANKDGVAQESASGPIVLRMQKKDGHWLASDIVDRN